MLYTTGIFIAFFLALIILTKKGRRRADTLLGLWMILTGMHLFAYYSVASGLIFRHTEILWLNLPFAFLHGPLLYLYTASLMRPETLDARRGVWHFVVPVLVYFSDLPVLFLTESDRLLYLSGELEMNRTVTLAQNIVLPVSGIFYVVMTYLLLYKRKKSEPSQSSDQISANWLKVLFYGMGVIWVIIVAGGKDEWIFSAASGFTVILGYFGIRKAGIFTDQVSVGQFNLAMSETSYDAGMVRKKYAKSGLNRDAAKSLHDQLKELMNRERLYTEPDLTLAHLAGRLDVHSNYLSQVINETEGVNFYDYVNSLRISEFKRLVLQPENQKYTLLALAYDCGFNSKSAFNRFFKKSTNLSPSEYLKIMA